MNVPIFCLVFFLSQILFATSQTSAQQNNSSQETRWPLAEGPFNFHNSYAWPSMDQSLMLSSSFYQSLHTLGERKLEQQGFSVSARKWFVVGADIISFYLPLGNSWLHEEWHRAVMSQRNIKSYNDVYRFQFFSEVIAVSHVEDEDLIRLKKDFPAEQVRLSSAGMESQVAQNLYLEKAQFFDQSPSWDQVILMSNAFSVWGYLNTCNDPATTQRIKDHNSKDGSDISVRDFTGFDCIAWVYDLFRPDEPYEQRGAHSSGVGIDRYRTITQLTDEEKSFLKKQEWLSLFNFADPFLLGFKQWNGKIGDVSFVWNAKMEHYLTSFGYAVNTVLFLNIFEKNFLIKSHHYFNNKRYFPGLSVELYKWPWRENILLSLGLSAWEQPKSQRFDAVAGQIGSSLDAEIIFTRYKDVYPFIYSNLKDEGWQVGRVALGKSFLLGTGISLIF